MSEQQQDKLDIVAPEAVGDISEERENAAAEPRKAKKPVKKSKKRRRNKKKRGVPVILMIILLILAVAVGAFFGVIVGYGLGRNTSSGRLQEANEQIDELTDLMVEENGVEIDVFTEELTAQNAAALSQLSGDLPSSDDVGQTPAMMSGEAFGSVDEAETDTAAVVVAEFAGGKLTSTEVAEEYNQEMTGLIFAGFNPEEVSENLLTGVMEGMVRDRVLKAQAKKLGLLDLTSADQDLIATEAQASFDEQVDYYRSYVRKDGMSEDEITAAAAEFLKATDGVTYESVYAELENGWWAQKLYDHVIEGVEADSADVLELYQARLEDQKTNFTAYPDDFEYAQKGGETIVYNLPGYRAVKMILLSFEDEDAEMAVYALEEELASLDPEKDITRISEIQNQLNAYYSAPEAQAKVVLDKLAAGEDFDSLLDLYGTDEGMKKPALRETGYYVAANSPLWHKNMISAAMALEKAGDVSAAFRTGEGVCIISYVGDVAEGDVPMTKVVDALTDEVLQQAQLDAYEQQCTQWIEEADVKYYPERMQ